MPTSKPPKRPRDPNQLAKAIVDIATGGSGAPLTLPSEARKEASSKGGIARAASLSVERKAEIAKGAAKRRWEAS